MKVTTTKKRILKKFTIAEIYNEPIDNEILIIQDSDMYAKIFIELNESKDYYYFYAEQKFESDREIMNFLFDNREDIKETENMDIDIIFDNYYERLNLVPACVLF